MIGIVIAILVAALVYWLCLILGLPSIVGIIATARMRAIRIARYGLRCTAPPCHSLARAGAPQAPANCGNLQRRALRVRQPGQKVVAQCRLGEARLDCGARDAPTSSSSSRPKCSRAIAYSPPTLAPKYGGSSEPT